MNDTPTQDPPKDAPSPADEGTRRERPDRVMRLKRTVESGQVRQNFSHGRSRSVVVETRRQRLVGPQAPGGDAAGGRPDASRPGDDRSDSLTSSERDRRRAAVARAGERDRFAAERPFRPPPPPADGGASAPDDRPSSSRSGDDPRRAVRTPDSHRAVPADPSPFPSAAPSARPAPPGKRREDRGDPAKAKEERFDAKKTPSTRPGDRQRRFGRLTINDALNDEERVRSLASMRRRRERDKRQSNASDASEKVIRTVRLPDTITIQELANRMAERAVDVIKNLMGHGVMAKINDVVDADTAQIVAEHFGHAVRRVSESAVETGVIGEDDPDSVKAPRPPVVTVMGHVDHGKTSLLDALRRTDVAGGEVRGITQRISAYQVRTPSGELVSFIDTPGHAAFTSMRARGAGLTDMVILVVAADDGVMPQTVESIGHARAANLPMIVAVNKTDKPDADPKRVRTGLLAAGIVTEDMGGDVQAIDVSAKTGAGLPDLLEAIALQAEILEPKANPDRDAEGVVVEATLDKGRGPLATLLIRRGTLRVGDAFVVGRMSGKVRVLNDHRGNRIDEAGPSTPVEVLGAGGVPDAGDVLSVVADEARAREIAAYRTRKAHDAAAATGPRAMSLDQMTHRLKDTGQGEMALVVKADVRGSVEAILQALAAVGNDEVHARAVHSGVGQITEGDIALAAASDATILAFNTRIAAPLAREAAAQGVTVRKYDVIYDLIADVKAHLSGMLSPDVRDVPIGRADVLDVFDVGGKKRKAAGCRIRSGVLRRKAKMRLIRGEKVVCDTTLTSLRRFKDEVNEVGSGMDCGVAFEDDVEPQAGDVVECYEVRETARALAD